MNDDLTEEEMQAMEEQIPDLAIKAFKEAFEKALATGRPVMIAKDGALWWVDKYGKKEFIKSIAPDVELKVKKL